MRIRRMLVVVAPLLALIACGGRMDPVGGGGGGGGSSSGGSGSSSGTGIGSSSGGGQCPVPSSIQEGASCAVDGLACQSDITETDCLGNPNPAGPLMCACDNGAWVCDAVATPCPIVACPAPSTIVPNGSCVEQPSYVSCPSTIPIEDCNGSTVGYVDCQCTTDRWSCPQTAPACPPDGGPPPCPPPQQVGQGVACSSPGEECPGNPQVCDGQVDYDAFQCQGGFWNDVAVTVCAVDAGPSDAGAFVDGGMGI